MGGVGVIWAVGHCRDFGGSCCSPTSKEALLNPRKPSHCGGVKASGALLAGLPSPRDLAFCSPLSDFKQLVVPTHQRAHVCLRGSPLFFPCSTGSPLARLRAPDPDGSNLSGTSALLQTRGQGLHRSLNILYAPDCSEVIISIRPTAGLFYLILKAAHILISNRF